MENNQKTETQQENFSTQLPPPPTADPESPLSNIYPLPNSKKGVKKTIILIIIILLIGIVITIIGLFSSNKSANDLLSSENPAKSPQLQQKNLNPGTGNLYEDIKVRLQEELK